MTDVVRRFALERKRRCVQSARFGRESAVSAWSAHGHLDRLRMSPPHIVQIKTRLWYRRVSPLNLSHFKYITPMSFAAAFVAARRWPRLPLLCAAEPT